MAINQSNTIEQFRIAFNQVDSDLGALQIDVVNNDSDILVLQTSLFQADSDILALQSGLSLLETEKDSDVLSLQTQITNNDSDIAARSLIGHEHTLSEISNWPDAVSPDEVAFLNGISEAIVTLTASQTLSNKTFSGPLLDSAQFTSSLTVSDSADNWSGTELVAMSRGFIQKVTLTGNVTSLTDGLSNGHGIIYLIDDGTSYTIDWSTLPVTWITGGGSSPTLQPTALTTVLLLKSNSSVYGFATNGA